MRPDLSGSGTHLLSFPVGDCPGGNVRKKALAAGKIEDCAFQLVGLFIDEPETGEVIRKVTCESTPRRNALRVVQVANSDSTAPMMSWRWSK
jgi:hypothetical protein